MILEIITFLLLYILAIGKTKINYVVNKSNIVKNKI